MTPIKIWFVVGLGGDRADFVSGWLGTLPGFVNNRWLIDPVSGVSYGYMGNFRSIDQGVPVDDIAKSYQLTISPHAEFIYAAACHGIRLNFKNYQSYVESGAIRFVTIDTSQANLNTINWEFYVKTYLSHRRTLDAVQGTCEQWVIDNQINLGTITDSDRIDKLKQLLSCPGVRKVSNYPTTLIDYTKLFCPGGSRYLCNQLSITAADSHHRYWDSMLEFSRSPDTINVWGVQWNKQDYFPD
jgi:hypothetical protein